MYAIMEGHILPGELSGNKLSFLPLNLTADSCLWRERQDNRQLEPWTQEFSCLQHSVVAILMPQAFLGHRGLQVASFHVQTFQQVRMWNHGKLPFLSSSNSDIIQQGDLGHKTNSRKDNTGLRWSLSGWLRLLHNTVTDPFPLLHNGSPEVIGCSFYSCGGLSGLHVQQLIGLH